MAILSGLSKVGSMSESLGLYVPAMILQKGLGLFRVLLFAHILRAAQAQYGLWGLAMMVFSLAAPLATLGANHGLVRYTGLYEARGQLATFYRRIRWGCLACAAGVAGAMLLASGPITIWVFASAQGGDGIAYRQQLHACWASLANVLAGALYFNMLALAAGLRAYRIASVVELVFSVTFTLAGSAVLVVWPEAVPLLAAHLGCLVLSLALGMVLLQGAIKDFPVPSQAASESGQSPATSAGPQGDETTGALRKVLGFGLVAMVGNFCWLAAQYVSFYMTNRRHSKADAGVFAVFMQLGQMVLLVANSAWAVIFSHITSRWESSRRREAMATLETAFNALSLVLMAVTLGVYATAPTWVKLLPTPYRVGLPLLGGLLMFCQSVANFSLVTVIARLHERPGWIALAALAGGAVNVVLAAWWMPAFSYAPAGAAWAAGVGVYIGAGVVSAVYFLLEGVRLRLVTYGVLASPILLVLPPWAGLAVWTAVLVVALMGKWFFDADEKQLILASAGGAFTLLRKAMSWR